MKISTFLRIIWLSVFFSTFKFTYLIKFVISFLFIFEILFIFGVLKILIFRKRFSTIHFGNIHYLDVETNITVKFVLNICRLIIGFFCLQRPYKVKQCTKKWYRCYEHSFWCIWLNVH